MNKNKGEKRPKEIPDGTLDNHPGGASDLIDNEFEHEDSFGELPANEQQLAEKTRRVAELCQYFSEHRIDIPAEIVERVAGIAKLTIPERVRALAEVNYDLMEYLGRVGVNPGNHQ